MRRAFITAALIILSVAAAACGSSVGAPATTKASGSGGDTTSTVATCQTTAQGQVLNKGQLTIGTDDPVYVPWFFGNRPENGLGYEAAVAYGIAHELGFSKAQVKWVLEPFNDSYAPGPKKFDFDINEISVTPARAQAVTFSVGYYNDNQALVAMANGPIVANHSPAALKTYVYGDQIGTTSLAYINTQIRPTTTTKVFNSLNDTQAALVAGQIQAFLTDTPTAQYIGATVTGATVIGQFPSNGEVFGLLFAKGNPLVTCVNKAIEALKAGGQLAHDSQKWLKAYNSIPTIKP